MKILHVTQGIDPKSGGPTRSVKGNLPRVGEGEGGRDAFGARGKSRVRQSVRGEGRLW